jgi:hypothetical protein
MRDKKYNIEVKHYENEKKNPIRRRIEQIKG